MSRLKMHAEPAVFGYSVVSSWWVSSRATSAAYLEMGLSSRGAATLNAQVPSSTARAKGCVGDQP